VTWAVRQGELTGASVEAVIAWHYPALAGGCAWAPVPAVAELDLAAIVAEALSDAVAESVDPASQVKVSPTARVGHAADVLLEDADGAGRLVVGSRRRGRFTGAPPGPVIEHCGQHATCPFVIIAEAGTHGG